MSTIKFTSRLLALVASICLFSSAHAGLIGDTVNIQYVGTGGSSSVNTHVVGAGEEGNFFNNQFYDFSDFGFSIRSTSSFGGIFSVNPADTITLKLGSLDFGSPLTSVFLSTNLTGVSTSFGSNSANFTWHEQGIPQGTYLTARFVTGAVVPEPGSIALLGVGVLALGLARFRRRS